jgi:hypothetical protein
MTANLRQRHVNTVRGFLPAFTVNVVWAGPEASSAACDATIASSASEYDFPERRQDGVRDEGAPSIEIRQ